MIQLTHEEKRKYYEEGKTVFLNYRTAYQLRYSQGVKDYVLQKVRGKCVGLPYTKRGRFHAFTEEEGYKLMTSN